MSERKTHDEKCEATGSNYIVYCRCPERRLERERDAALGSLEMMLETVAEPPASNCSCHISAPCSDCVDFGGLREAFGLARATLRAIEEGRK